MDTHYIEIFDAHHLLYLSLFICVLALLLINRQFVRRRRKAVALGLIVASLIQQVLIHGYHFWSTGYSLDVSLPLHICRLASLLGLWYLFTKNDSALQMGFYFGLFAFGSFAYPSKIMPIYHPLGLSFVMSHILIIVIPWFAVIADDWQPTVRGMKLAMIGFSGYFVSVYLLNPLVNGNYFYLVNRPFLDNLPEIVYVPLIYLATLVIFRFGYWLFGQNLFKYVVSPRTWQIKL